MNTAEDPEALPHPEDLLREAEDEEPRRVLDDYIEVIRTLREKRFTFREVAAWLNERGFAVDHNTVWRAYAKTVPDDVAALEADHDDRLEQEEDYEEARVNGQVVSSLPSVSETPVAPLPPVAAKPALTKATKVGSKAKRAKK